ncbi:MAG: amino acid adenylation domain-containing protein [Desulfamplus sp.]
MRHNLFDQLLVFENYPDPSDVLGESQMGLSLTGFEQFEQTNYDLTVEVFPGERIEYEILFNPDAFAEDVVKAIAIHIERAASSVLADENILVSSILILNDQEREFYNSYITDITETLNINIENRELNSDNSSDNRRLTTKYAAPENEIQEKLAAIWEEVLERTNIGIDDNFFEIGGHSLRATRIVSRIHKVLSAEITLQEFFVKPDIRTIAKLIEVRLKPSLVSNEESKPLSSSDSAGISKTKIYQNIPLCPPSQPDYEVSHAQRRLWILDKMEENFTAYNQSAGFLFKGRFDTKLFKKAVEFAATRHESLRTVFVEKEDMEKLNEPRQKIVANQKILFSEIDLSVDPEPEKAAKEIASKLPHQMFDLANGPLWSAAILKLGKNQHVILLNIHHIICDGWSLVILENEVLTAYLTLLKGQKPDMKPLPLQYKDFAAWQNRRLHSAEMDKHRSYWHEKLKGEIPVLNLPTDFTRPLVRTYSGAVVRTEIPADQIQEFNRFCSKNRASLFTGLAALLKVLLFRYTSQEDIIIGSPVAGRDHADLEGQIGFFVNTLALRDMLKPDMRFSELLETVGTTVIEAFDHQLYPFDRLVEELNVLRDVGRSPIFDVMLVLQNNVGVTASIEGVSISEFDFELNQSQFDLTFIFSEGGNGLTFDINYNTDLFYKETVERMAGHFITLMTNAVKEPDAEISRLNILTKSEYQLLTSGFNTHTRPYPEDKTLASLFEEVVLRNPDRDAVIYQDRTLTYRELNKSADILAVYLVQNCRIKPDMPAAVLLNRSELVPAALIGVLKSGGIYLPLDPESPFKRLEYIISDSGADVIITDDANIELAEKLNPSKIINIQTCLWSALSDSLIQKENLSQADNFNKMEELSSIKNLTPSSPTDLAYIIYTSGSTGEPKGVMVEHRSFINMILAQIEGFDITPDDRVLQFATLMFDASMSEIFMALLSGAAVVMIDREQIQDTARFIDYMEHKKITAITLPPVYLKMLNRCPLPNLRVLITAGEPAIKEDALFYSTTKSYFNAYGPTETAVCTSFHKVDPNACYGDTIPIGTPIANNAVFILDNHLNPVPIGVAGELCFAGVGVARGYLNRADLTSEKFIPCPFNISHPFNKNRQIYRIGDIGRWLSNGNIEFLGRVDEQVKIRGFRIEPGEIASALKTFDNIEDAFVTVYCNESEQNNHLAAYIVTKSQPLQTELRRHLSERLPPYMIPSVFIPLSAFPMTINGKIDKRALPDPAYAMQEQLEKNKHDKNLSQPINSLEKKIQSVWQTIFNRTDIGRDDDFFNLGGDSIKAIRMVSLLREKAVAVKVKDIFKWTTISELAKYGAKEIILTYTIAQFSGRVTQTPIYRWFFDHFKEYANHFNHADLFYSKNRLDPLSIKAALNAVIAHHDMLRLTCNKTDGVELVIPEQNENINSSGYINLTDSKTFEVVDLKNLPVEEAQNALSRIAGKVQESFDLFDPLNPLIKVVLFQLADSDRLFIVIHHLIGDAVSWRILLEDLESAYNQHQSLLNAKYIEQEKTEQKEIREKEIEHDRTIKLPQKTTPFPVWAEALEKYSRSEALQSEKEYWINVINKPFGRLPADNTLENNIISNQAKSTMADTDTLEIKWESANTQKIIDAARRLNTGVDRVLLAALAWCCRCQHGHSSTLISLESYGRPELFDNIDVSRTIGWFTATYPMVISVSKDDLKKENIEQDIIDIDKELKLVSNNGIGWGLLKYLTSKNMRLESLAASKSLEITDSKERLNFNSNMFDLNPDINFNYLGEFEAYSRDMFKPALEDTGRSAALGAAVIHDLDINGAVAQGQLQVIWNYNQKRFTKEWINKMVQDFSLLIDKILCHSKH